MGETNSSGSGEETLSTPFIAICQFPQRQCHAVTD